MCVLLDQNVSLGELVVWGDLRLVDDARLEINTTGITVEGGRISAGNFTHPRVHAALFTILPSLSTDEPAIQAYGVIQMVGVQLSDRDQTSCHHTSWSRLRATLPPGGWYAELDSTAEWSAGDMVFLASSSTNPMEAEQRKITNISGNLVGLDRPVAHEHIGGVSVNAHDVSAGAHLVNDKLWHVRTWLFLPSPFLREIVRRNWAPDKIDSYHISWPWSVWFSRWTSVEVGRFSAVGRGGVFWLRWSCLCIILLTYWCRYAVTRPRLFSPVCCDALFLCWHNNNNKQHLYIGQQ